MKIPPIFYVLGPDARTPVPARDALEWARGHQDAHTRVGGPPRPGDGWARVALDKLQLATVSTIFAGLANFRPSGPPLLFETMVFGGPLDLQKDLYSTWDEAEVGHAVMLQRVLAHEVRH